MKFHYFCPPGKIVSANPGKTTIGTPLMMSVHRMMNVHREKIRKNKQLFIDRFRRDPRRLQLLFLSEADKDCL